MKKHLHKLVEPGVSQEELAQILTQLRALVRMNPTMQCDALHASGS